jgi:hypothetical protein
MARPKKGSIVTVALSADVLMSQLSTDQLLAEIQKRIGGGGRMAAVTQSAAGDASEASPSNGRKRRKKRNMSPEGRARIAAAAKKRWADAKKKGKSKL